MTTSSIGSGGGRDYSTIASWEAAAAATLTATWEGECYNDSEFSVAGNIVTFAGITASSTNFIELRPASGEGFKDDAGAASNPLRYDQSKGVGLKCTASYVGAVLVQVNHVRLRGLQVQHTGNGNDSACISEDTGASSSNLIRDCILEHTGNSATYGSALYVRGGTAENVAVIHRGSGNQIAGVGESGPTITNCTFVRPSDLSDLSRVIVKFFSASCTVTNTAGFGCTNFTGGGGSGFSGSNNATDLASVGFGSSNQTSLTYSSQFENVNDGTHDFRAKSGGGLIDNGTTGTTGDIIGQSASGTKDIGAWELQSAAGASLSSAKTLAGITSAATVLGIASVTSAKTLAGITSAASINAQTTATITSAKTLAGVTSAATLKSVASLTSAKTLTGLTSAATVLAVASITSAKTLAGVTSTAEIAAAAREITAAQTLAGVTSSAAATSAQPAGASASITLAGITSSAIIVTGHVVPRDWEPANDASTTWTPKAAASSTWAAKARPTTTWTRRT